MNQTKHRLTEEQETYRISRIKESLKGKPATEFQRNRRTEGLRAAYLDGRIKPRIITQEEIDRRSDKLRGRKRPQEVVEKVRAANLGKKRTAEQIEAHRKRVVDGYAAGKYRSLPEAIERRRLASIAALKGKPRTAEQNKHHSEVMTGRKNLPETVAKRVEKMIGRPQKVPVVAKGPQNKNSSEGVLRDASGRVWFFRNLTHFVRTHEHLFLPEDVEWKPKTIGRGDLRCRAQKGLLNLFGRGKTVPGSWKGWTVADSTVELSQGFADLIGRDRAEIV